MTVVKILSSATLIHCSFTPVFSETTTALC